MKFEAGTCSHCQRKTKVLTSEFNPLVAPICSSCIVSKVNVNRSESIKLLSETYRISLNLNEFYAAMASSSDPVEAMTNYLEFLTKESIPLSEKTVPWNEITRIWHDKLTLEELLLKIAPLREAFMIKATEAWGPDFTFQQYVKMEDIFNNTLKAFDISDPIKRDAIRKAAKLSVQIDDLLAISDFDSVKKAVAAYKSFMDMANIKELSDIANDRDIKTVADLYRFMEENGFDFYKLKPTVSQDQIDKTLQNYTDNLRTIVADATGLDVMIKEAVEKFKREEEDLLAKQAYEDLPLAAGHNDDDDVWLGEGEDIDDLIYGEDFSFEGILDE